MLFADQTFSAVAAAASLLAAAELSFFPVIKIPYPPRAAINAIVARARSSRDEARFTGAGPGAP